ncbi:MAG: hypothetical protein IJK92_08960 [Bacteroidales bacterium]|nr:hypothetical protein [Bacteroidales bacterium]
MEKLTKHQQDGIAEMMHHIHNKEVVQCILETLGEKNWNRDILSSCSSYLTEKQEEIFESLGGNYSSEELDEEWDNDGINSEIAKILKKQGVTHYLYENEDYLNEIREGKIICEGIDVEDIKDMIAVGEEEETEDDYVEFGQAREVEFSYKGNILKGRLHWADGAVSWSLQIPEGTLLYPIMWRDPDFTDEEAESMAKKGLKNLWWVYNEILTHKDEILKVLPPCIKMEQEIKAIQQKIHELKKSQEEGVINKTDYRKALRPIAEKRNTLYGNLIDLFDDTMRKIIQVDTTYFDSNKEMIYKIIGINV